MRPSSRWTTTYPEPVTPSTTTPTAKTPRAAPDVPVRPDTGAQPDVPARLDAPARRVAIAAVSTEPLDAAAHVDAVGGPAAGATVSFSGVVRDHDAGRSVQLLRYVGHPSAAAVVERVAEAVAAAHLVDAVAVSHRLGDLVVGDVALVVAVSAAHRREAFEAAEALVEAVKAELPVWKHQVFTDGTDEWVSCP